jgi:hypothetical protein
MESGLVLACPWLIVVEVAQLVTRFADESAAELGTGNVLPLAPVVTHSSCGSKRERRVACTWASAIV